MNEACHITDMHMRAVFFRDIAEIDRVSESAREIDVETVRKSNLSSRSPVDMRTLRSTGAQRHVLSGQAHASPARSPL